MFVRWTWCRAFLHRGWWAVTSVYLVVDAHLTASELVLVGVGQSAAALVFEVPAGVLADTVSRKWSLVVSHALMGAAMVATGMVSGFVPVLVTQMLWGLAWNFAGGADVAWISDELGEPGAVSAVLMRAEQAQLTGTVAGLAGVSALAWLTGPGTAMTAAGTAMLLLGLYVVARFPERRFRPVRAKQTSARGRTRSVVARPGSIRARARWVGAKTRSGGAMQWAVLMRGVALVRGSRVVVGIFAATFLVSGVVNAFGRLYPLRLVEVGLAVDPVVWLGGLGVLMSLGGAVALRLVRRRLDGVRTLRRGFVVAGAVAGVGVVGLAVAPEEFGGSLAVLLAAGALPLTRTFTTVWINELAVSAVRATVHSLLAQAKYLGEIACGFAVAAVAHLSSTPRGLLVCAALVVVAVWLVGRIGLPGREHCGSRR
ncbi:MFS transporter [Actinoplanes sp. LDG1-06]|uniref:MFS transporter n=1 Tax=Paractinoplanes ovalisporus TaxID=2810368 RepID=A0ABS2A8M2_9ACTN|nr:MFS transporter [Actinoplanes ovalisporus]MBM2616100.1 MFS transporter [Actinoplanes ovalisporus]